MTVKNDFWSISNSNSFISTKKAKQSVIDNSLKQDFTKQSSASIPSTIAFLATFNGVSLRSADVFNKTLKDLLVNKNDFPEANLQFPYELSSAPNFAENENTKEIKNLLSRIENKPLNSIYHTPELMEDIKECFDKASSNLGEQINALKDNQSDNNLIETKLLRLEELKEILDKASNSVEVLQGNNSEIEKMVAFTGNGKKSSLKTSVLLGLMALAMLVIPKSPISLVSPSTVSATNIWENYTEQFASHYFGRRDFLDRVWARMSLWEKTMFERIENDEAWSYYCYGKGIPVTQENVNLMTKRIFAGRQDAGFIQAWMQYHSMGWNQFGGDCLSPRKVNIWLEVGYENNKIKQQTGRYLAINNTNNPYKDSNVQHMVKVSGATQPELFYVCLCMLQDQSWQNFEDNMNDFMRKMQSWN